jgi:LmbE family N-acetylglucosaminyl deacetylase
VAESGLDKRMLVVTAHPDDESFGPGGTLARYAQEGVAVHLVCATRGEAGGSDDAGVGDCEDLACRREKELRCAAQVLGLASVDLLGYRDSGMSGSAANRDPRALVQADTEAVAKQVLAFMGQYRPQVVLTSDPYGGYGHPDHIAVHRATLRAFEMAQAGALAPEDRPRKLYYSTFPRTMLRWTVRIMPLLGRDPSALGKNKDIDLREVLAHAIPITTHIATGRYYDLREQASACHSSQLSGPSSISGWAPKWLLKRFRGDETFNRAWPTFQPVEPIERDLFAGIN